MTVTDLHIPDSYRPLLDALATQRAVSFAKQVFEREFSMALNLMPVAAPLFLESGTGINDDLNGIERPVTFRAPALGGCRVEVVQSLAKWKRLILANMDVPAGAGIYTHMNAIRPDEQLDNLHSLLVDQWDWERVITDEDRSLDFLKQVVTHIYEALHTTEREISNEYPVLQPVLPAQVTFIHSEELQELYPDLEPMQREDRIALDTGAVFIIGIGAPLRDGRPHDDRAPDYDDWSTPNGYGRGLNGDLLVWDELLGCSLEITSMGIRVTPEVLAAQLEQQGLQERKSLYYHRRLLAEELPLTVGGGIGQSRVCMFLLRKAHIGEVQAGAWPPTVREACRRRDVLLL